MDRNKQEQKKQNNIKEATMTMLKQNKTLFFEEFLWKFDPGFPCRKSKVEFGETNCHVLGGVSRNMLLDPT